MGDLSAAAYERDHARLMAIRLAAAAGQTDREGCREILTRGVSQPASPSRSPICRQHCMIDEPIKRMSFEAFLELLAIFRLPCRIRIVRAKTRPSDPDSNDAEVMRRSAAAACITGRLPRMRREGRSWAARQFKKPRK
jgi:hypothetical protein